VVVFLSFPPNFVLHLSFFKFGGSSILFGSCGFGGRATCSHQYFRFRWRRFESGCHHFIFLPACTYVQRGSKFCFVVVVLVVLVVVVLGDTLIKLQWQDTKLQWQDTKLQWQDTKLQ
jgi:hypothetical protein